MAIVALTHPFVIGVDTHALAILAAPHGELIDKAQFPATAAGLARAMTLSRIAARPRAFSHGHFSDHHPSPGGPPSHTSRLRFAYPVACTQR